MRNNLHLMDREPELRCHGMPYGFFEPDRVALKSFRADDELLFAVNRHPERHHVSAPNSGEFAGRPLDVIRVVVAAANDDDVLESPAHIQVPVGEVTEIAGV